jgi:phosphoribosylamine--glycine ligase
MAAQNYPESPKTGDEITNIPPDDEFHVVFHAGTILENESVKNRVVVEFYV